MTKAIIVEETTEAPVEKTSFLEKFTTRTKLIAAGVGVGAIAIAAAVVFAVKRQDEEDFEDEFPDSSDSDAATV